MIYNLLYNLFIKLYPKSTSDIIPIILQFLAHDIQSGYLSYQKLALSFIRKSVKVEANMDASFTKLCATNLSELIISLLTNVDDTFYFNQEEEEKPLIYFAYHALKSIITDESILLIIKHFQENYSSEDWKVRCSSVIALKAAIKAGSQTISPLLSNINELLNDEKLIVRLYSQSFIAKYIEKYDICQDPKENFDFVFNLAFDLLKKEVEEACLGLDIIFGYCKIGKRLEFIEQEQFFNILNTLWLQFGRNDVTKLKFNEHLTKLIPVLVSNIPIYKVAEVLMPFCVVVLHKIVEYVIPLFNENADSDVGESTKIILNNFLYIFGIVFYRLKTCLNDQFVNEAFQCLIQFLPKMEEIPRLLISIGNVIMAVPSQSANYVSSLINYLIKAQKSLIDDLISSSSILIGDLYRSCPSIMSEYTSTFCNLLIKNVQNDDLSYKTIGNILTNLADLVRNSPPELIVSYRDEMVDIINNVGTCNFDPTNEDDIENMTHLVEGITCLSGAILKIFADDNEFINDKKDILFSFRYLMKPDLFPSSDIDYALIICIDDAISNRYLARQCNIQLNHSYIKERLKSIGNSNNEDLRQKAKSLSSILINV